jgi:hypothetical protein
VYTSRQQKKFNRSGQSAQLQNILIALDGARSDVGRAARGMTVVAIDRTMSARLKGHSCFLMALGACDVGQDANVATSARVSHRQAAARTALWYVGQIPLGEKLLFADGEDEISTTIGASQCFRFKRHVLIGL